MTTLPVLGSLLTAPPWVLTLVLLAITPGMHLALSRWAEDRRVNLEDDYPAVLFGDPALAVAAGLSLWVADGEVSALADWRVGIVAIVVGVAFGAVQSRLEFAEGRYSRDQLASPSKRFHQYGVYPSLGYLLPSSFAAGLGNTGRAPLVMVVVVALMIVWFVLTLDAIRNPRLGHGTRRGASSD